ncbi:hypothetical protein [Kluyvera sp. Awk 3]|uniref:hypothetical protein n=1 Tax=Kluyvera sp. Awk 3 TaxID=2963956 RepID=UPI002303BE3C|nr:hypothetical protein [Kluyvera sp. Awk 3]MDA8487453.1 hypothetical protein [Kluyvera sp. Awk 3]
MSRKNNHPTVINWLDNCPSCGHGKAVVNTEGNENLLFYGDQVTCMQCGHCGEIDTEDNTAFVVWDEIENKAEANND